MVWRLSSTVGYLAVSEVGLFIAVIRILYYIYYILYIIIFEYLWRLASTAGPGGLPRA